jgi:hypothetical protein
MAIEKFFINGDVLDRVNSFPGFPIKYAIDQQERVAMR